MAKTEQTEVKDLANNETRNNEERDLAVTDKGGPATAADDRVSVEPLVRSEVSDEETKASDVRTFAGVGVSGTDLLASDHLAQRFSNPPANPQPAPGLDPDLSDDRKVKLVMETSDTLARGEGPLVMFADPTMVGDYLRAGWTRASVASLVS